MRWMPITYPVKGGWIIIFACLPILSEDSPGRLREKDSSFVDAYDRLGLAYSKKGQYDEAISWYQAAIRLDPDHVRARPKYGDAGVSFGACGDDRRGRDLRWGQRG